MKKTILILMLALVILAAGFATGCANEAPDTNVNQENTAAQNDAVSNEVIDEYLASVKEQSDAINTSFENDPLTQTELNIKSMELAELWDGALNYMIDALKTRLS